MLGGFLYVALNVIYFVFTYGSMGMLAVAPTSGSMPPITAGWI
jgi:hypothetical protein